MQDHSEAQGSKAIIRLGRSMQMSWDVALGLSLAISLNAFVLVGWVTSQAQDPVFPAYLLSLLFFLPMVLTYADRTMAARGRSNRAIFALLLADGTDLRTFAGGWLLLIGYASLAALLARGLGWYLGILVQSWFGLALDTRWLGLLWLLLGTLLPLTGASRIGSLRVKLVYAGLGLVMVIVIWMAFNPADVALAVEKQALDLWSTVALLAPSLWTIGLLLRHRQQTQTRRSAWLPALSIPFLLAGVLGALTSATQGYPHVWSEDLNSPARLVATLDPMLLETIFVVTGLFVCFVALGGIVASGLGLVGDLAECGYLPTGKTSEGGRSRGSWVALLVAFAASGLLIVLVPTHILVGLASLGFLWVTALLNGPDSFRTRSALARRGRFQLPFHPLFPGLATAIGVFLPFALGLPVLLAGSGWLLVGVTYYLAYARRHSAGVREGRPTVRETAVDLPSRDYTVIAAITSPYSAVSLVRAGARLAKAREGRLLVLQVLALSEHLPERMKRYQAQEQLQTLEGTVQRASTEQDVLVVPFVRVSREVTTGIIDTVREEAPDLLLLAWEETRGQEVLNRVWERVSASATETTETEESREEEGGEMTPPLDAIVRGVACDVAVLRGQWPHKIERVLVPTSGSPYLSTAFRLGQDLTAEGEGSIAALHVVVEEAGPQPSLLSGLDDTTGIEELVVRADNIQAGILREARQADLLLISTSRPSLLEEHLFGAIPVEVTRAHRRPTLLLRPSQRATYLSLRKAWYWIRGLFAALTADERTAISTQMREAAQPSANFFVLITLAATIATLGLLQNSGAVIIGAMLVAPLMSPIASTAMGIVEGDARLMRVAGEAILKGIAAAMTVSIAITILSPEPPALDQILARTQPNLLDLAVAMASGAAAGYALSRREVSAALPGVSIAVALVPPLCVVGYGIATSQFDIAGGATLLFLTNVIAIILAAVVVFLLLGFRPLLAQQEQFQRGLVVSVVSLILIAIPLALLLNVSLGRLESRRQQAALEKEVGTILGEAIPPEAGRVVDVSVEFGEDESVVHATIYNYGEWGDDELTRLKELLSAELELPVRLEATVLNARRLDGE